MKIKHYYGQTSYTVASDKAEAQISVAGGHVTAEFDIGGRKVNPYFIAPWWNDSIDELHGSCEYPLRGVFFAFPFGASSPRDGIERPCHGFVAGRDWQYESSCDADGSSTVKLYMDVPEENAHVEKKVTLKQGETVMYLSDTVSGAKGNYPVGYHPTLQVPDELGNAYLDVSANKGCYSAPTHMDKPEEGGYSCLPEGIEIADPTHVKNLFGNYMDLTRLPHIKGFDDIYMYVYDESLPFNYAAITVPSEGYLYFQLKNPKTLSNAMIWCENCGRNAPHWSSRVNGCLEVGAGTNYFFYGLDRADGNDPLTEKGFKMFHTFDGSPREYKLISGVVPVPSSYKGVADIKRADAEYIVIVGKDGSEMTVKCSVDFLF